MAAGIAHMVTVAGASTCCARCSGCNGGAIRDGDDSGEAQACSGGEHCEQQEGKDDGGTQAIIEALLAQNARRRNAPAARSPGKVGQGFEVEQRASAAALNERDIL